MLDPVSVVMGDHWPSVGNIWYRAEGIQWKQHFRWRHNYVSTK